MVHQYCNRSEDFCQGSEGKLETHTYDTTKAIKAQKRYCDERLVPLFIPSNGWCGYCGRNIFEPYRVRGFDKNGGHPERIFGITVEEAGNRHITGCPHCGITFGD